MAKDRFKCVIVAAMKIRKDKLAASNVIALLHQFFAQEVTLCYLSSSRLAANCTRNTVNARCCAAEL